MIEEFYTPYVSVLNPKTFFFLLFLLTIVILTIVFNWWKGKYSAKTNIPNEAGPLMQELEVVIRIPIAIEPENEVSRARFVKWFTENRDEEIPADLAVKMYAAGRRVLDEVLAGPDREKFLISCTLADCDIEKVLTQPHNTQEMIINNATKELDTETAELILNPELSNTHFLTDRAGSAFQAVRIAEPTLSIQTVTRNCPNGLTHAELA